jgi:hypothetical protein
MLFSQPSCKSNSSIEDTFKRAFEFVREKYPITGTKSESTYCPTLFLEAYEKSIAYLKSLKGSEILNNIQSESAKIFFRELLQAKIISFGENKNGYGDLQLRAYAAYGCLLTTNDFDNLNLIECICERGSPWYPRKAYYFITYHDRKTECEYVCDFDTETVHTEKFQQDPIKKYLSKDDNYTTTINGRIGFLLDENFTSPQAFELFKQIAAAKTEDELKRLFEIPDNTHVAAPGLSKS